MFPQPGDLVEWAGGVALFLRWKPYGQENRIELSGLIGIPENVFMRRVPSRHGMFFVFKDGELVTGVTGDIHETMRVLMPFVDAEEV